jgi:hypothetical protein
MAIFPSPKLLKSSDFQQDNQELITSIGNILNPTLEQMYTALNKGIDFNNLNQEIITFSVQVGATGTPKSPLEIKTSLNSKIQGSVCIRVIGNSYPTSNPLLSFDYNSSTKSIKINNITGLAADVTYSLTVILIG